MAVGKMEYFAVYCFGLSLVGLVALLAAAFVASSFGDKLQYLNKINNWMVEGYFLKISMSLFLLSISIVTFSVIIRCVFDDIPLGTRIIIGLSCAFGMVISLLGLREQWKCELLRMKDSFTSIKGRGNP